MGGKERKSLMKVQKHTNRKVVCVMFTVEERGNVPEKTFVFEKLPWKIGKV